MQVRIPAYLKGKLHLGWQFFGKLTVASLVMVVSVTLMRWGLLSLLPDLNRIGLSLVVIVIVLVGILVFATMSIELRLFTIREWLTIPYGKKLLKKLIK